MPKLKPIYYWDTNIWISWLMNEPLPDGVMEGIEDIAETAERGKAGIIVSDCLDTELLDGDWDNTTRTKFDNLFKRKTVKKVRITPNITQMSKEIRQYYKSLKAKDPKEKVPSGMDALHLATAIVHGVDAFHTLDDGKSGGRSLLAMNGNVAGHNLVICRPPVPLQPKLFFK